VTNLSQLLSRVEEAQGPSKRLSFDIALALLVPDYEGTAETWFGPSVASTHYTSNLDSALALVERCQPDCFWQVGHDSDDPACYRARILPALLTPVIEASGATPALALLAALLKSIISTASAS
jgi:hypothetical protein